MLSHIAYLPFVRAATVFKTPRMMADDNVLSKSSNIFCLNKMKDRPEHDQVMAYKSFSMYRLVQTMHRVVEKSCRRACQLLCCSIDNLRCDRLAICPGQKEQQHSRDQHSAAAEAWSPPSTTFIVNICNSTVIGCVIGNVSEQKPLMQNSEPKGCSPAPESLLPSIKIKNSDVSYVIIGNNNHMQVAQTPHSDEESEEVCEDGK